MFKKLTAFALSAAMLFTAALQSFTVAAGEEEAAPQPASDVSIQSSNSFGNLLANELTEKQAEQLANNGCNIFSVEMNGTEATVSFQTTSDCTLVIGIYDESGTTLYATGTAEVSPEEKETKVTIETDQMPEYFYVKGYLCDTYDLAPLCTVYECPNYTQEMQEFFSMTTDDFDADRVLNFDEDTTNNFAVYGDDTIVIPQKEGYNIVTSADDVNGVYVIENADENILSLQEGDIFSYEYGENELLLVKVGSIEIDGTTVTITAADMQMEEAFGYVRVEAEGGMEDAETFANPDIEVPEENTIAANASIAQATSDGFEKEKELKYTFDKEYSKDKSVPYKTGKTDENGNPIYRQLGDLSCDAKIQGEASLKAGFRANIYYVTKNFLWHEYNAGIDYVEMEISYEGNLNLSASVDVSFSIKFEGLKFSLLYGTITLKITPELLLKLKANVDFDGKWWGSVGGRARVEKSGVHLENISQRPQHHIESKMEGSLYIGIKLKPQISVIHEKIVSAKMEGDIGIELDQKRELDYDSSKDYSLEDSVHDCTWCYDGDVYLAGDLKFSIQFLGYETKEKYLVGSADSMAKKKILDYYWSVDREEFALTECPHTLYRLEFDVYDKSGNEPIKDADVSLAASAVLNDDYAIKQMTENGLVDVMTIPSDEEGKAVFFVSAGKGKSEKLFLSVKKDGYQNAKGEYIPNQKNGKLNLDDKLGNVIEVEMEKKTNTDNQNEYWVIFHNGDKNGELELCKAQSSEVQKSYGTKS